MATKAYRPAASHIYTGCQSLVLVFNAHNCIATKAHWVIYDQNFRQEAAERNQTSDWARIDSSLFAQCFTGQAKSSESWCKSCHSLDHLSDACPLRPPPPKRPKAASSRSQDSEICRRFNTGNGGCPFGVRCHYAHRCAKCGSGHPSKLCSAKPAASSTSKSME